MLVARPAGWSKGAFSWQARARRPIREGESFVGVRFRPGMSRVVVDGDAVALLGRDVRAADIDPAFELLESRLAEAATMRERLIVLQRAVAASARTRLAHAAPDRMRMAIELLGTTDASLRIAAVADSIGASERSLRREVFEWTGLSPRRLARILRFQTALTMVRVRTDRSLTAIAHEAGYADHPHMTREFKALSGVTPSTLRLPVA